MGFLAKLRPDFWDSGRVTSGLLSHSFNLRRLWKVTVSFVATVAIAPLVVMTAIDYTVTRRSAESETLLLTSRVASNTKRAVRFSLEERLSALDFIVRDNDLQALTDRRRLTAILDGLQTSSSGFVDLGVIDSSGRQRCYVGPYDLGGADYSSQEWFREAIDGGPHVSDVFPGFRRVPHLVISVRRDLSGGDFIILRASLEAEFFDNILGGLELSGRGDAFMINTEGTLQTTSRHHGPVLEIVDLAVPDFSERTEVFEDSGADGTPLIIGYSYIPGTPFILMIVKQKNVLLQPWRTPRRQIMGFLAVSITAILLTVFGVATFLVNRIHQADLRRVATLHQIEYENKMASLGRLGAGVAHEINNPLAIINEKAGLIKDMFTYSDRYSDDPKLMGIVDSILRSAERCSSITRRLLSFARTTEADLGTVDLADAVQEVMEFMGKEAEYRSVEIEIDIGDETPAISAHRGKLQQILLNLVTNAFAAVDDGGRISVRALLGGANRVVIEVEDDGCGIPEADVNRVFEPFFTTKGHQGTGLGLSITYSLVQEMGGTLKVRSKLGEGTKFKIQLPISPSN